MRGALWGTADRRRWRIRPRAAAWPAAVAAASLAIAAPPGGERPVADRYAEARERMVRDDIAGGA